jgi:hypothetical protein
MLRAQSPPSLPQKVPENEPPPGAPTGPLRRELPVSRTFFNMCLEFLIKVLQIKRNISLLSKALGKERPPFSPKRDPYGNRRPFSEPYLAYPSGFPVKEPTLNITLT